MTARTVSLRKADALAKALRDEVLKIGFASTVSVSAHAADTVDARLAETSQAMRAALDDAVHISAQSFAIRAVLGEAFTASGISRLLTEKAGLDAEEKLLTAVWSSKGAGTDPALAKPRLKALLDSVQPGAPLRASQDSLSISLLPEAYDGLEERLRDIRLRKSAIADKLLNLNLTHTVPLTPEVVAVCERFRLI